MTDYILELSYHSDDTVVEDLIQARLFMAGSSGSSSREAGGTTVVSAYFGSRAARDDAARLFRDLDVEVTSAECRRMDWLDQYQQSLHAIPIGRRFMVAPEAALLAGSDERLHIVVPQEQAFGTGSHETTALCMEMLESLDVDGAMGLDIGSGSGILAMAMLRLGARRVVAFDNDLDAFAALRDNRRRNGIAAESMPLFIGPVEAMRGGVFDLITMNIVPEVILPLLPRVSGHLGEEGTIILSGILAARRTDVIAAASLAKLRIEKEIDRGEWWCGSFARHTKSLAKPSQMY